MNKEEIDIWLKHFADKQTGYQMFDENGMRREINFFIVFRYLKELQQKVNQLETKINTYENPEDMTLMFMWCDEKAKDKINQLETNRDEAIEYIKARELTKLSRDCYAVHEVSFRNILSILERGKE